MEAANLGPGKKNAKIWRAWIVFLDESGISEQPPVRRTWAPRGQTPLVVHPFNWKKLSICSVIAYWWNGRRCRLFFRVVGGSYNDVKLIDFLEHLMHQPSMGRLILLWDGLPSHRSQRMTQYLQQQESRLRILRLPAYAPDTNPVEGLWANIQGHELANRSVNGLEEMVEGVRSGFTRVRSESWLLQSFLNHAGFSLD